MGAPTHTDLIGLDHAELLARAPAATHQHYKGGLYRDLGSLPGLPSRAYVHLYPHKQDPWIRSQEEFDGQHEGAPRFQPLTGADTSIPDERIDHGLALDADTNSPFLIEGEPCRLITENGRAFLIPDGE